MQRTLSLPPQDQARKGPIIGSLPARSAPLAPRGSAGHGSEAQAILCIENDILLEEGPRIEGLDQAWGERGCAIILTVVTSLENVLQEVY